MRSLTVTRYGGPEVLQLRESPDPVAGPGEVLVAVKRAGLNFSDIAARVGVYRGAPSPPVVLGYEVAGVVAALGRGAQGFAVGDRVFAMTRFGGHASHVAVPAAQVTALPPRLSFDQAAALPVAYLTAFHLLFHVGALRPFDTVFLNMAASGVGLAVIDLCRTVPGVTLIGTASGPKHQRLRELGLTHPIDYRTEDYLARTLELTGGRGVQLALDPLGGPDWHRCYSLLRRAGHLVAFGWANMVPGERLRPLAMARQLIGTRRYSPFALMQANKSVSGVDLGGLWGEVPLLRGHVDRLIALPVEPHIDAVFPLSKGADAHRHVQARKNVGRVVFDCEA